MCAPSQCACAGSYLSVLPPHNVRSDPGLHFHLPLSSLIRSLVRFFVAWHACMRVDVDKLQSPTDVPRIFHGLFLQLQAMLLPPAYLCFPAAHPPGATRPGSSVWPSTTHTTSLRLRHGVCISLSFANPPSPLAPPHADLSAGLNTAPPL